MYGLVRQQNRETLARTANEVAGQPRVPGRLVVQVDGLIAESGVSWRETPNTEIARMQPTGQRIIESLDDPNELEALYRQDPESFRGCFDEVSSVVQDSTTLRVWAARLEYSEPARGAEEKRRLWYAIAIGLCVGALVRIPAIWLGEEWYYPRLAPSLVLLALAAYFWLENRNRGGLVAGLALAAIATT